MEYFFFEIWRSKKFHHTFWKKVTFSYFCVSFLWEKIWEDWENIQNTKSKPAPQPSSSTFFPCKSETVSDKYLTRSSEHSQIFIPPSYTRTEKKYTNWPTDLYSFSCTKQNYHFWPNHYFHSNILVYCPYFQLHQHNQYVLSPKLLQLLEGLFHIQNFHLHFHVLRIDFHHLLHSIYIRRVST